MIYKAIVSEVPYIFGDGTNISYFHTVNPMGFDHDKVQGFGWCYHCNVDLESMTMCYGVYIANSLYSMDRSIDMYIARMH